MRARSFRSGLLLGTVIGIVALGTVTVPYFVVRTPGVPPPSSIDTFALISTARYDDAERVARARLAVRQATHGAASLDAAAAALELAEALLANGRGTDRETLEIAKGALDRYVSTLGRTHPATLAATVTVSRVFIERGDFPPAIAMLQRAVAVQETQHGRDSIEAAAVLDVLGAAFAQERSYDAAIEVLTRSLRIRAASPRQDESVAGTFETLAYAHQGRGRYRDAREALDRASAARTGASGDTLGHVRALNLTALQLWFEGRLFESRSVSLDAVSRAERELRPEHPELAKSLRVIAASVAALGDMAGAHEYASRALAIARASLGPAHYELAGYLNDLADVNLTMGAYSEARAQFQQSLAIVEATVGSNHEWVPNIVHNLALVDARLGDLALARAEHARATEHWERRLGASHPFVATALTQLAVVLREQGAARDAVELLERALAIRERALGAGHQDTARTLADLAETLSLLGQDDRAQSLAARALRVWEGLGQEDAPEWGAVLSLYARLQLAGGSLIEARSYFERALAVGRSVLGPDHPLVAETQLGLAFTLAALGRTTEASANAVNAEVVGREHLRLMLRYLPERQSLIYAARRAKGLDLILSLASDVQSTRVAFDALIRSRALVLDETAARRGASVVPHEVEAPARAHLVLAQQRLANLAVRGPGTEPLARYRDLLEEASRERDEAERSLAARSASFRAQLSQSQAGLDDVRDSLPEGAALVSFIRFQQLSTSLSPENAPGGVRTGDGRAAYAGLVLRKDRSPVAVPVVDAALIEARVTAWRTEVAFPSTGQGADNEPELQETGRKLRELVWDPIAPHLQGATTIFIVPDGALNLVPFAALPGRRSEFLIEEAPALHYLSAERDLLPKARFVAGRGLLAVGGPAFDAEIDRPRFGAAGSAMRSASGGIDAGTECHTVRDLRFRPLFGSVREVQQIAELWNANGASRTEGARLLLAQEANEATFKREAPRHRVLHLATHGFFLPLLCGDRGDGTRRAGGGSATMPIAMTSAESDLAPRLFSGLALASANQRAVAADNEEDGILTAEEIAGLDLKQVEWAILSACDTGLGEVRPGEGVLGLRRAFHVAGARTVVMSLWAVDDEATSLWMRQLYSGRLTKRLSTVDAMREASLNELRARRRGGERTHPFYWAAFVAAGDWT